MTRLFFYALCYLSGYAISVHFLMEVNMLNFLGGLVLGILVGYVGKDVIGKLIDLLLGRL